jgi:DNA-binding XRE family transcriptional regulator
MSTKTRPAPRVDQVTPELEALLAQFSDEEIASGIIARGTTSTPTERHTPEALLEHLDDALLQRSLAELLRSARTTADFSLADMAERLGVSRSRVHQLEQEGANLELQTLLRCASALGYDMRVVFVPREHDKPALTAPVN